MDVKPSVSRKQCLFHCSNFEMATYIDLNVSNHYMLNGLIGFSVFNYYACMEMPKLCLDATATFKM